MGNQSSEINKVLRHKINVCVRVPMGSTHTVIIQLALWVIALRVMFELLAINLLVSGFFLAVKC